MSLWIILKSAHFQESQRALRASIQSYEQALRLSKDPAAIKGCNVILKALRKELK